MRGWFAKVLAIALLLGASRGSFAGDIGCQNDCRLIRFGGLPVSWPVPAAGAPLELTIAVVHEGRSSGGSNCGNLIPPTFGNSKDSIDDDAFMRALSRVMARWEAAANIRFELSSDHTAANIVIGAQATPRGIAFVDLATEIDVKHQRHFIHRAAICFNDQVRWKLGFDADLSSFDVERVLLHEFGHVLGLDHPSARGQIMSFRYSEAFADLTEGDVKGARLLYGPPGPDRRGKPVTTTSALGSRLSGP